MLLNIWAAFVKTKIICLSKKPNLVTLTRRRITRSNLLQKKWNKFNELIRVEGRKGEVRGC